MHGADWFEMAPDKKSRLATASWVPLFQRLKSQGLEYPETGWWEEYISTVAVFFPDSVQNLESKVKWSDVRRAYGNRPEVSSEEYTPARECYSHDIDPDDGYLVIGEYACLEIDNSDKWEILIEPDLLCALGLVKDGDDWLYPHEDFPRVIRQKRDERNRVVSVEIRGPFLKDYLCARKSQLLVASYRSRNEVFDNLTFALPEALSTAGIEYECRDLEIDSDGREYGVTVGTFVVGRTDVDPHDDVPIMEFAKDGDTWSESNEFVSDNGKKHRIIGELWKSEVVRPGTKSPIVRDDDVESTVEFIVDNDAATMVASQLIRPPSRWLWFSPKIVQTVLDKTNTTLIWYTEDTGAIRLPDWGPIHFGTNPQDLINVYAKDVAQLSVWWQKVFSSHNVAPDGRVSRELMASQMECKPASTIAPEAMLPKAVVFACSAFERRFGMKLFRDHEAESQLWSAAHRFAATDETELLKLMKNLTRLCIERLDLGNLKKLTPTLDKSVASIKRLESVISAEGEDGRRMTGVLVGVNELRQRDSHLPSSNEIEDSFELVGVNREDSTVQQAKTTMGNLAQCFVEIGDAFARAAEHKE